ncbi:MAG: TlpA disulfide reductase family protein [Rhodanobacter sp.]
MSRTNWLILTLALLAAIAGGYVGRRHPHASLSMDSPLIGQLVPSLVLPDLDGKPHALNEYRGHRVVLNFWASWCGPCLQEMPILARAQKNVGDRLPRVIGIAMDDSVSVRRFLVAHAVNYPILLGQLSPPSTSLLLGDTAELLPYSVLVGADGRILATHMGALSDSQVQQWLKPGLTAD